MPITAIPAEILQLPRYIGRQRSSFPSLISRDILLPVPAWPARSSFTPPGDIPGKIEGYGRDDSPEFCAMRMEELIAENNYASHAVAPIKEPEIPPAQYGFSTVTGKVWIDHKKCLNCLDKGCVQSCSAGILKLEDGKPVLAVSEEEVKKGKCTECLACEVFCKFQAEDAVFIHLPIPGLKEYRDKIRGKD